MRSPHLRASRRARRLLVALAAVAATASLAPAAGAMLRSPHLEASCPSGYSYGERDFGALVVEGCSKAAATAERADQRLYRGDMEVNGLLVEPQGAEDAHVWTAEEIVGSGIFAARARVAHVRRQSATQLWIDGQIAGRQRKFRLYTGDVDFRVASSPTVIDGVDQPASTIDIPITFGPSILGLRLRSGIDDVRLSRSGMVLPLSLSLGQNAPALLRDNTAAVELELRDGIGMRLTGFEFRIARFELPGVGGFRDFHISYSESDDRWRGGTTLLLGGAFDSRTFLFDVEVRASDGVPTRIELAAANMNYPIGSSGIYLQGVRATFGFIPFELASGVTITAGQQIHGASLIELAGDSVFSFEPGFRFESVTTARILPTGPSNELATGRVTLVFDGDGYIRLTHDLRYQTHILGVGASARLNGTGEYATDRNRFNVDANATGTLDLGSFGEFDVVRLGAVVSSDGWAACGELADGIFSFLTGGVGQQWNRDVEVLLGCDLSPYRARVRSLTVRRPATGRAPATLETTVTVPDAPVVALRIRADAVAPSFRLIGPGGKAFDIGPANGHAGTAGGVLAAWLAGADSDTTHVFLKGAAPGTWTIRWLEGAPSVTAVAIAEKAPAIKGTASVVRRAGARAGVRRLGVRLTGGLGAGEQLAVAIRGPKGAIPLGIVGAGGRLDLDFAERGTGRRTIIGRVLRNGIPLPGRTVQLGAYTATAPARPAAIRIARIGHSRRVRIRAVLQKGAERPDGWAYRIRGLGRTIALRGAVGKPVVIVLPRRASLTVAAAPVVAGRVLPVKARIKKVARV